jgi:hypothetical protein
MRKGDFHLQFSECVLCHFEYTICFSFIFLHLILPERVGPFTPPPLYHREESLPPPPHSTHWIGGCMTPKSILGAMVNKNIPVCNGNRLRISLSKKSSYVCTLHYLHVYLDIMFSDETPQIIIINKEKALIVF